MIQNMHLTNSRRPFFYPENVESLRDRVFMLMDSNKFCVEDEKIYTLLKESFNATCWDKTLRHHCRTTRRTELMRTVSLRVWHDIRLEVRPFVDQLVRRGIKLHLDLDVDIESECMEKDDYEQYCKVLLNVNLTFEKHVLNVKQVWLRVLVHLYLTLSVICYATYTC